MNRIYVPTCNRDGQPLAAPLIRHIGKLATERMVELFGGVTATGGRGAWKGSNGQMIVEDVMVLESWGVGDADGLRTLAGEIVEIANQESVMIVIQGTQEFIYANPR